MQDRTQFEIDLGRQHPDEAWPKSVFGVLWLEHEQLESVQLYRWPIPMTKVMEKKDLICDNELCHWIKS